MQMQTGNLSKQAHPQLCRRHFMLRPVSDNALAITHPVEHQMLDFLNPHPEHHDMLHAGSATVSLASDAHTLCEDSK
jgi:7,8-dihydro-6-hydroxymethylpterin-pyrophosphokinase